jgi:hypothetical protein
MGAWGIGLYASDFALDLRATVGAVVRLPLDEEKLVAAICAAEETTAENPADEDHTVFWLVLADQFEKRLCPPYSAAALTDEVNNKLRGAIRAAHAGRGTRSPSSASASVSPSGSGLPRVSGKKGTARSPRM